MKPLETYHRRWHKFMFYLTHAHFEVLPYEWVKKDIVPIKRDFALLPEDVRDYLQKRIDYCCAITTPFDVHELAKDMVERKGNRLTRIADFHRDHNSSYFFDLSEYLPYFPKDHYFFYEFGDVTHVPERPTIVKSRPIAGDNRNSVLMRLDSFRHFYVYPDPYDFSQKQDKLVWRGGVHQPHRLNFVKQYHQHPLCDVGCVHKNSIGQAYHREFLSVKQQMAYKYILSIEGNDVATNLKWISASHSVCFMTRPKYETWFAEGLLIPNVHYVALEDDYSDLDEKLKFYQAHPEAAQKIISAAQAYIQPFLNKKWEKIANVLVLDKYFGLAGK